jgi:hypothetical protein
MHPDLKQTVPTQYSGKIASPQVPMSTINLMLCDTSFRAAVWRHFEIPQAVSLPAFSDILLYGDLSTGVHAAFEKIYVADNAPADHKAFFRELGRLCKIPISEFASSQADNAVKHLGLRA